jgi:hypothetical protein
LTKPVLAEHEDEVVEHFRIEESESHGVDSKEVVVLPFVGDLSYHFIHSFCEGVYLREVRRRTFFISKMSSSYVQQPLQ